MNDETTEIVLSELRGLREEAHEFREDVTRWRQGIAERIATLEAQAKDVLGNGQPGRLARAESDIRALSRFRWMLLGAVSLASVLAEWGQSKHTEISIDTASAVTVVTADASTSLFKVLVCESSCSWMFVSFAKLGTLNRVRQRQFCC